MASIREIAGPRPPAAFVLRPPVPGDLGWVVQRARGAVRAEYGWDADFEALVAQIVADYAAGHDPRGSAGGSRSWAACPRDACSACARAARPRSCGCCWSSRGPAAWAWAAAWSPSASRSPGPGYREIVLWTKDVLHAARRIYQRAGFQLVARRRTTASVTTWWSRTGGWRSADSQAQPQLPAADVLAPDLGYRRWNSRITWTPRRRRGARPERAAGEELQVAGEGFGLADDHPRDLEQQDGTRAHLAGRERGIHGHALVGGPRPALRRHAISPCARVPCCPLVRRAASSFRPRPGRLDGNAPAARPERVLSRARPLEVAAVAGRSYPWPGTTRPVS